MRFLRPCFVAALLGMAGSCSATHPKDARSLEHFRQIKPEMTHEQVEALVGKPDREVGSGLEINVYDLKNGTQVSIGWAGSRLMYVRHKSLTADDDLLKR